jgi:hypothetical protein
MATRMQQRRGTAEQWTLADPVLAAGEIGFETDTNSFKLGNGVDSWEELPYFIDSEGLDGQLEDYIPLAQKAADNGVATLDNDGQVPANQLGNVTVDLSNYATLDGSTFTGPVILDADPSQALGAATKAYVDNVATGIISKPAVRAATTTNLSAIYNNGVNGVGATLTADTDRIFTALDGVTSWSITTPPMGVLVKNQTNKAENGRYNLTSLGSESSPWVLTRCGLCDEADEIPGAYVFVQNGTANKGTGWIQVVADPDTFEVGTDDISVFQFSGEGSYTAGNGLTLTGTQFAIDTAVTATQSDLASKQNVVSGVSDTEIGYLDGVTSAIQTQLNSKAPTASPTFTGNVTFGEGIKAIVNQPTTSFEATWQTGYIGMPRDLYTLFGFSEDDFVIDIHDSGRLIHSPSSRTLTLPNGSWTASSGEGIETGTTIVFSTGGSATLTLQGSMVQVGEGSVSTNELFLAPFGLATAVFISAAGVWYVSGVGLSQ